MTAMYQAADVVPGDVIRFARADHAVKTVHRPSGTRVVLVLDDGTEWVVPTTALVTVAVASQRPVRPTS